MASEWDWIDKKEEEIKKEKSEKVSQYFEIVEGKQQFMLLTHCAPLPQVFDQSTKKYRAAEEGDKNVSIKGVCWVLQDGVIKQAKLPYSVVKAIRNLQQDPEWEFSIPFPHTLSLEATNAGTKEVKYALTPSPKKSEIPPAVLMELAKKPKPEDIVEFIKNRPTTVAPAGQPAKDYDYPQEDINPEDVPF